MESIDKIDENIELEHFYVPFDECFLGNYKAKKTKIGGLF